MSVEYRTDTARTVNIPPLFVLQGAQAEVLREDLEEEISGGVGLRIDETTTSPVSLAQAQPIEDVSTVVLNVNRYVASYDAFVPQRAWSCHASQWTAYRFHYEARLTVRSQRTAPQASTMQPGRPVQVDTAGDTGRVAWATLSRVIDKWAVKLATENLKKARDAAVAGDLRVAYRNAYRGLDELFRRGKWEVVGSELAEICKDRYPATFGIGAMRFSSEAAKHIPGWSTLLKTLATVASRQGMDVGRAMRGLLDSDGTPRRFG